MSDATDLLENSLRADAPPLSGAGVPTVGQLTGRAAVRRRRRTLAAAGCGLLAAALALRPTPQPPTPDETLAAAPPVETAEPVEVDLVVNAAGVLEVRARRGGVFCTIPLEEPTPAPPESAVRAVPFWQVEPAAQDRVIEAWIRTGQLAGLEV